MPRKKGKAKTYRNTEKHKTKAEVIKSQEADEGKAKRPRAAASRASLLKDHSSEEDDDAEGYDIHGAPTMHDEDDEINNAGSSCESEKFRRMDMFFLRDCV